MRRGIDHTKSSAGGGRQPREIHTPAKAPAPGVTFDCTGPKRPTSLAGSEHSRTDGDVPPARVAALERQRPRRDKSTGYEQGDQKAARGQCSPITFYDEFFAKRDEDYMRWIVADDEERERIAREYGEDGS